MRGRVPVIGGDGSTALAAANGDSIRITGDSAFSAPSAEEAPDFQYEATLTGWPMQRMKPRKTLEALCAETPTSNQFGSTYSGVKGTVS